MWSLINVVTRSSLFILLLVATVFEHGGIFHVSGSTETTNMSESYNSQPNASSGSIWVFDDLQVLNKVRFRREDIFEITDEVKDDIEYGSQ